MNFFDILKSLLFNKSAYINNIEDFTSFMVNRWLSFYDKSKACFVNDILNRYCGIFDNTNDAYNFYYNIVPVSRFKKINYIKKQKETQDSKSKDIAKMEQIIASNRQISIREIRQYIDLCKDCHI
jgi:hypothetical protein